MQLGDLLLNSLCHALNCSKCFAVLGGDCPIAEAASDVEEQGVLQLGKTLTWNKYWSDCCFQTRAKALFDG